MPSPLIWAITAFAILPFSNAALPASKSARCGPQFKLTCQGSSFGKCCSNQNYCGSSIAYCGTGCQAGYGSCNNLPAPPSPIKISQDGSCGGKKGLTCLGSMFGNCCRQYGFCGSSQGCCGAGCNAQFGKCSGVQSYSSMTSTRSTLVSNVRSSSASTRTSISAAQSSTLKVTTNARCGKELGFTCQGSKWGDCCSQYSYW